MENVIKDRFKDKVMVVTGAAGGIGKSVAVRAAKEGAKLILADMKEEMSKETLKEIREITPNVEFLIMDVSNAENAKKVIDTAVDKFGTMDILINDAGITGTPAPLHLMSEEMFKRVYECNIMTTFNMSKNFINHMINEKKGGAIVNLSSVAGITGFPGHAAYVSSKHALIGLTRNMAIDCAKYGIRVNAVNPGTTITPMFYEALDFLKSKRSQMETAGVKLDDVLPPGTKIKSPQDRYAEADEVASAILYLASNEASNITGIFMPVDGGFTAY